MPSSIFVFPSPLSPKNRFTPKEQSTMVCLWLRNDSSTRRCNFKPGLPYLQHDSPSSSSEWGYQQ
jgi:hypothetical protein